MAVLNLDLGGLLANRRKRQEDAALRAELLRSVAAEAGFTGADPTQPVQNLAGVSAAEAVDRPEVALRRQLANEDAENTRREALPMVSAWQRALLAAQGGLNPEQLAGAADQTLRTATLMRELQALAPAARVDAANAKSVAPVGVQGGVAFNRFDPANPILGESSGALAQGTQRLAAAGASDAQARAADALARERDAARRVTTLRADALAGVIGQPGTDPLLAADVANAKSVSAPTRVKVAGKDGQAVYYDATARPDGGVDYTPASGPGGAPLAVPVSESGDGGTALQRDTAFIAQTLGMSPQEAILYKLQSRAKSDAALWEDLLLRQVSASFGRPPKMDEVRAIWDQLRPGVAPPVDVAGAPGAGTPAPAAAGPDAPAAEDPRYAEARAAIAAGAPRDAVEARMRALGLDPGGL